MAANAFLNTFDKLRHRDGSEDILKRKAELSMLVKALSPNELRFLKDASTRAVQSNFHRDPVRSLQIEIFRLISSYLTLQDWVRLRGVSREWRAVLGCPEICLAMYEKPSLFNFLLYKNSSDDAKAKAKAELTRTFPLFVNRHLNRQYANYRAVAAYQYPQYLGEKHHEWQACGDRLALKYIGSRFGQDEDQITLLTLGTSLIQYYKKSRALQTDNCPWVLSSEYLVAIGDERNPLKLSCWSLADPTLMYERTFWRECEALYSSRSWLGLYFGQRTLNGQIQQHWTLMNLNTKAETIINMPQYDLDDHMDSNSAGRRMVLDYMPINECCYVVNISTGLQPPFRTHEGFEVIVHEFRKGLYTGNCYKHTVDSSWHRDQPAQTEGGVLSARGWTFGIGIVSTTNIPPRAYGATRTRSTVVLAFNTKRHEFAYSHEDMDIAMRRAALRPAEWFCATLDISNTVIVGPRYSLVMFAEGYVIFAFEESDQLDTTKPACLKLVTVPRGRATKSGAAIFGRTVCRRLNKGT